jgi:diketogulonate reductase-like aldo/keto reductase
MEYASVGGVDVPAIGLGTWQLTGQECYRAVSTALELGYRHVDTAQAYENEREVGRAIADAGVDREDVFLTTKITPGNAQYGKVRRSTRESLDRLGTDYVDLLLLHWPNPIVDFADTARAMAELVDDGFARNVGVSNFSRRRLETARRVADVPLLTNQVQFHPYRPKRKLLRYCQDEDVLLTAYSPLARGGILDDEVLGTIATKYGASPAQVALRWAVQHRNVVAIPKSSDPDHLRANLEIFEFTLSADEMERIARPSLVRTGLAWAKAELGV